MATHWTSSAMEGDHQIHAAAGTGRKLAKAIIVVAGVAALVSSLISFL